MTALFLSLSLVSTKGVGYTPFQPTALDTMDFWVIIGDGGSSDSVFGLQPSPNPNSYYLGVTVGEPCIQIANAGGGAYTGYFGFWWPDVVPPNYTEVKEPGFKTQQFFNYLSPPSPNPTRGRARINYGVAEESRVSLAIYDLSGRRVKTLVSGNLKPGNYSVVWTGASDAGSRVSQGLYILKYETGSFQKVDKLLLIK